MLTKVKFNRIALAVALSLGIASSAVANETTSGIRGQITNPTGAPAANVSVVITHVPTGAVKTVTTNEQGAYRVKGLRVGGPYKVLLDSDQYRDEEFEDIYLQLSKAERISVQLESADLERISVVSARPAFTSAGSSSYFGEFDIQNQTGTTRDMKDLLRSNPLVNVSNNGDRSMTIAGSNPRFNSITVDGIAQNDNFGLNGGGYPTQRSPLPLDALSQITVDVAPFNTKVSGFSGGHVNAVLKSGTNDFSGSVFVEKFSDDLAGNPVDENGVESELAEFSSTTKGASLFGPIIKDKLFFALSYEGYESPQTLEFGPDGSSALLKTNATVEEMNDVIRVAQSVYGMTDEQLGSWDLQPVEEDTKYTVKLDWNINEDHRAALTYQNSEGNRTRSFTSSAGTLKLSSNWYNVYEKLNNVSAFLYSDWSEDFSTEMSVTVQDKINRQQSYGSTADVTVRGLESGGAIRFGSDEFRHANSLDNQFTKYSFEGTYMLGDHSITGGVVYDIRATQNLFVPNSLGKYDFASLADFEAQLANRYTYENGTGNDPFNAGADFEQQTTSLFIQDSWDVTYDLNVTYGVRYERLTTDGKPPYNIASEARTGYRNDANLDGLDIFLPRVGFNYTLSDDTTIRGGVGRYTGGAPDVWISNAWSQNGVANGKFVATDFAVPSNGLTGIPQAGLDALENAVNNGDVSLTDPNFVMPSDYRAQIAVDQIIDIPLLGDDYELTAEYMYVTRKDSQFWRDASLQEWDIAGYSKDGGRILYNDDDTNYDIMLTNAGDGGRSKLFTLQLAKSFDNGFNLSMSYANQDVTESNEGASSTARSNYRYSPAINRNIPADHLGAGRYSIEHAFNMNLSYQKAFFGDYNTTVNMFLSRSSGAAVSYIIQPSASTAYDQIVPDFSAGNFLAYIPTANDPNMNYGADPVAAAEMESELLASIQEAGLTQFAGSYAPKNSTQLPWNTTLDMAISQEIPGLVDGVKGKLYMTISNVLNLIDKDKGKFFENRFGTYRLYTISGYDAEGRAMVDDIKNDSPTFDREDSTWRVNVGVRFSF